MGFIVRFQTEMKDLELMVQNIILTAFETVTTVAGSVELLDIFSHLSSREVQSANYFFISYVHNHSLMNTRTCFLVVFCFPSYNIKYLTVSSVEPCPLR